MQEKQSQRAKGCFSNTKDNLALCILCGRGSGAAYTLLFIKHLNLCSHYLIMETLLDWTFCSLKFAINTKLRIKLCIF